MYWCSRGYASGVLVIDLIVFVVRVPLYGQVRLLPSLLAINGVYSWFSDEKKLIPPYFLSNYDFANVTV